MRWLFRHVRRAVFGPGPTGILWSYDATTAIAAGLGTYVAVEDGNLELAAFLVLVSLAFFVRAIRGLRDDI